MRDDEHLHNRDKTFPGGYSKPEELFVRHRINSALADRALTIACFMYRKVFDSLQSRDRRVSGIGDPKYEVRHSYFVYYITSALCIYHAFRHGYVE